MTRDLRQLADDLSQPTVARFVATLLQAAQRDPAARRHLDQWLNQIDQRLRAAGVDTDDDVAGDAASLLIGPLLYRAVLQSAPVSDALIDRAVSVALGSSPDAERR